MTNKETKEFVVGVNELSLFLVQRLRDGVQLSDFEALWDKLKDDAEFKAKVQDAYLGATAIPSEVADLDMGEVIDLATVQISYVPKFIAAILKG